MYATQLGNFKIVELLVESGKARVDTKNIQDQRTALHYACINGHTRIVNYLLMFTNNVDTLDLYKNTPLYYTCKHGWFFSMKLLLQFLIEKKKLNDKLIQNVFRIAYLYTNLNICNEFLRSNQLRMTDEIKQDLTFLYFKLSDNVSLHQFIYLSLNNQYTMKDSKNSNMLHYLAKNQDHTNNILIAEVILPTNKDLLYSLNCMLETPLMLAVTYSNIELTEYLFENFFMTNGEIRHTTAISDLLKKQNIHGETLLHLIAKNCLKKPTLHDLVNVNVLNLNKYRSEFEFMASVEDNKQRTPFVCACEALDEHLSAGCMCHGQS
jgi:ankyrin repeat protein